MRVDSDDDFEDYDMLESDDDRDGQHAIDDTPASTPPSSTLPRCRQKTLKCPYENCDKAFNRQARLKEHIRSHTNERPFKCPHTACDKAFLRDSHLKHHVKNQHSDVRDHLCTWEGCDATFTTGTRLRRHLETHEAKEKFRCRGFPGCNQTFRRQDTLDRHILSVHQNIRPFPCTEMDTVTGMPCNKAYDTAENLRTHQRTRHDPTRYSCSDCMAHNAALMAETGESAPEGVRLASFPTYGELQAHNAIFHPPTCPHCPTSFTTNKELTRHLEIQHAILPAKKLESAPVFTCTSPGCGKEFTKRGNLNVHLKTVHENKRDFVCGKTEIALPAELVNQDDIVVHGCNRSFTSKASLEEHVRTAHLGLESKRMMREKKRKAIQPPENDDEDTFPFAETKPAKKRKPRSDKGIKKSSAIAGLTGMLPETGRPRLETTNSNTRDMNDPEIFDAPLLMDEMDCEDVKDDLLSGSMTMCGSQIFHYGSSYHYPSGEYPTLQQAFAQASVHDDEHDAEHGEAADRDLPTLDFSTLMSLPPESSVENEVDDNFFGRFEHEPEWETERQAFAYPAP